MALVRAGRAVVAPNLGLYLDRPPFMVPERGCSAMMNVRVSNGQLVHDNMGWSRFPGNGKSVNLDGKPVTLIASFTARDAITKTIFGNTTDLFVWDGAVEAVHYITPNYVEGTVDVTSGSAVVTGSGTLWSANLKAGDYIHIGSDDERSPAAEWYRIAAVNSDTQLTLESEYEGTTGAGLSYTARQTFTGSMADPFYTETFYGASHLTEGADGDRWYATNGIDPIVAWDGSSPTVYRPNLGNGTLETCKFLRRYKNVMFYVAPRVSGELRSFSVRTSAIGRPEDVATLEASEFIVHDGADPLVAAEHIGELLAIYSKRTITLAQYVGPPLMYVFRTAATGYGPRSPRAIAKFPDHHRFVGADSMYRFDGVAARPEDTHIWKEVTRQISPQRAGLLTAFFDESRGELHWITPLNSDEDTSNGPPEQAFTLHYLEDVGDEPSPYSRRELPALALGHYQRATTLTWAQLTETWEHYNFRWNDQFLQATFPFTLFGDAEGNIFILNDGNTQAGQPITALARMSRRPVVDSRVNGVVKRVYPFIETVQGAAGHLTVRVRTYDSPNTNTPRHTADSTVAVAPGNQRFAAFRVPGRYTDVEFRSTTSNVWAVAGYDMDFVRGGER